MGEPSISSINQPTSRKKNYDPYNVGLVERNMQRKPWDFMGDTVPSFPLPQLFPGPWAKSEAPAAAPSRARSRGPPRRHLALPPHPGAPRRWGDTSCGARRRGRTPGPKPKSWGLGGAAPLDHPLKNGMFHEINPSRYWGTTLLGNLRTQVSSLGNRTPVYPQCHLGPEDALQGQHLSYFLGNPGST